MSKEITITNANNQEKFICFKINGLEDGIMVGLYPNGDGLSIAYKGDVVGVPFDANSALIDELNDNSFPTDISDEVVTLSDEDLEKIKNIDFSKIFKIGTAEDIFNDVYKKDEK